MSRPKKRAGSFGQARDLRRRHGQVWSYYRAVYDADRNKAGRATRAEQSCMEHFGIDRSTVQRKVRIMKSIAAVALTPQERAAVTAAFDASQKSGEKLAAAVAAKIITAAIASEMEYMTPAAITWLLKRLSRRN